MRAKIFVVIYTFEDVIGKSFNLDVVPNVDWHVFGFGFHLNRDLCSLMLIQGQVEVLEGRMSGASSRLIQQAILFHSIYRDMHDVVDNDDKQERISKDSVSPSAVIIDDRVLVYKTLMASIVSDRIP